jgi:hypothetical protein
MPDHEREIGRDWDRPRRVHKKGPNGDPGRKGKVPAPVPPPQKGRDGKAGSTSIAVADYSALVAVASYESMSMVLRAGELDYLNEDFEGAMRRFGWLKRCLSFGRPQSNPALEPQHRALVPAEVVNSLEDRVDGFLTQLAMGQDYYGKGLNHVSLLRPDYYTRILDNVFQHAAAIETSYREFFDATSDQAKQHTALLGAMRSVRSLIETKRRDIEDWDTHALTLQNEILAERALLNDLWIRLIDASNDFKEAVHRKHKGKCGFKQILTVGASLAAAVSTGGSGWAMAVSAFQSLRASELKDDKGNLIEDAGWEKAKYYGKHIGDLGKGVSNLAKAGEELIAAFERPDAPKVEGLPNDERKLLAKADDIYKQIREHAELKEAQKYKQLLEQFMELALTRNKKILTHDAIIAAIVIARAEADTARRELVIIQNDVATNENPMVPLFAEFMTKAHRQARTDICRLLNQAHRAYRYFALTDVSFRVADHSVDMLRTTYLAIIDLLTRAKENFGRPPQRLSGFKLAIASLVDPSQMDHFRKTGMIVFTLPKGRPFPSRMAHILVTSVDVELLGVPASKETTYVYCTQHGSSVIFDRGDVRREFTHTSVSVTVAIQPDGSRAGGSGELGNDHGEFTSVSPFGTWSIEINDPDRIQLRRLKDLELSFSVTFQHGN